MDIAFGLDDSSTIGAPEDIGGDPDADWFFLPPQPPGPDPVLEPGIDLLEYVSLDPADDVPVGGSLGGFFFYSTTSPDSLGPGDFAVEAVGYPVPVDPDIGFQTEEIPLADAKVLPEPTTLLLLGSGLAGILARRRIRRAR